jgi:hypothetical protein
MSRHDGDEEEVRREYRRTGEEIAERWARLAEADWRNPLTFVAGLSLACGDLCRKLAGWIMGEGDR